jgi:hypothetical protein
MDPAWVDRPSDSRACKPSMARDRVSFGWVGLPDPLETDSGLELWLELGFNLA